MTNQFAESFEAYVQEEYKIYPDVGGELMDFYESLDSDLERGHFELHIRDHHNNAFSSKGAWKFEIKARLAVVNITGNASTVLFQAYSKPIEDGDVESKNGLRWCRNSKLITTIATSNGSLNAATELGGRVAVLLAGNLLSNIKMALTNLLKNTIGESWELKVVLDFLEALPDEQRRFFLKYVENNPKFMEDSVQQWKQYTYAYWYISFMTIDDKINLGRIRDEAIVDAKETTDFIEYDLVETDINGGFRLTNLGRKVYHLTRKDAEYELNIRSRNRLWTEMVRNNESIADKVDIFNRAWDADKDHGNAHLVSAITIKPEALESVESVLLHSRAYALRTSASPDIIKEVRKVVDAGGVKYQPLNVGLTITTMRELDLLELNEEKNFLNVTKLAKLIIEYQEIIDG